MQTIYDGAATGVHEDTTRMVLLFQGDQGIECRMICRVAKTLPLFLFLV
jgi:hypothetical protein